MLEYESLYDLFKSLNVPNNSSIHWSNNGGWTLLNSCSCKSMRLNSKGHSIFQVPSNLMWWTINNGSWMCIHFMCLNFGSKFQFCFKSNGLWIVWAPLSSLKLSWLPWWNMGGYQRWMWQKKLLFFDADGAFVFLGGRRQGS
jgi:hypothetical protein